MIPRYHLLDGQGCGCVRTSRKGQFRVWHSGPKDVPNAVWNVRYDFIGGLRGQYAETRFQVYGDVGHSRVLAIDKTFGVLGFTLLGVFESGHRGVGDSAWSFVGNVQNNAYIPGSIYVHTPTFRMIEIRVFALKHPKGVIVCPREWDFGHFGDPHIHVDYEWLKVWFIHDCRDDRWATEQRVSSVSHAKYVISDDSSQISQRRVDVIDHDTSRDTVYDRIEGHNTGFSIIRYIYDFGSGLSLFWARGFGGRGSTLFSRTFWEYIRRAFTCDMWSICGWHLHV